MAARRWGVDSLGAAVAMASRYQRTRLEPSETGRARASCAYVRGQGAVYAVFTVSGSDASPFLANVTSACI
jgi:hypothetical protein